jgi:hypothetical protein
MDPPVAEALSTAAAEEMAAEFVVDGEHHPSRPDIDSTEVRTPALSI